MTAAIKINSKDQEIAEQRAAIARANLRQVVQSLARAIDHTDDPALFQPLINCERVIASIAGAV